MSLTAAHEPSEENPKGTIGVAVLVFFEDGEGLVGRFQFDGAVETEVFEGFDDRSLFGEGA